MCSWEGGGRVGPSMAGASEAGSWAQIRQKLSGHSKGSAFY